MSFFKRVTNLGKGMWKVHTGPFDPDEERRIKALQAELNRREGQTGAARTQARPGLSHTGSTHAGSTHAVQATDEEVLAAKLALLADQLREGQIDRATYDARCGELIAAVEEEAPRAAHKVERTL